MSAGSKILMLGLRGAGKTSYLAALWHFLEAGGTPQPLRASQLQPDREYLNAIRNSWLEFKDVGRTPLSVIQTITMVLEEAAAGKQHSVVVPDLSGEAFRLQWATRKATRAYAEDVRTCTGILFFIHPEEIIRTKVLEPSRTAPEPGPQPIPWSPKLASTQVQFVELLQFVDYLKGEGIPIAVVVSAWDLVKTKMPPLAWIEDRLPLLGQYLLANSARSPYAVFGVSALGGDLQKDFDRLASEVVPIKRVRVSEHGTESSHDVSLPLQFLLGMNTSGRRASVA